MIYKSSHLELDKHSPVLKQIHDRHLQELRELLQSLYEQLKPEQQHVFRLMYKTLDQVKEEQLAWAICQCEASVIKNMKEIK